jgi:predicted dehydrogenase
MKLGIIGAGRLGSFHADKAAAYSNVQISGIYDESSAASEALAKKHNCIAFHSLDELLTQVEAVVVATPSTTHNAVGIRCLNAGCHVLMEKPLCVTSVEAAQLVTLAREHNRVLQVGHIEQFNPAWHSAAPILDRVASGEQALLETTRTSGYTFRSTDIGVVLDMMIHDIDLVMSVVPSLINNVDAVGFYVIDSSRKQGHEDIAQARITFDNGTVATLYASRVASEAVRKMNIITERQSATIDFATRTAKFIEPSEEVVTGNFAANKISPVEAAKLAPTFMKEHFKVTELAENAVDALSLEMSDFINAIEKKYEPKVNGKQGLTAVQVAERILKQIHTTETMTEKRAA